MTQASEAAAAIEGWYVQGNAEFQNVLLRALLTDDFTEVTEWLGADECRVDSTAPGKGLFVANFADGSYIHQNVVVR